jgi:hypothetical protein
MKIKKGKIGHKNNLLQDKISHSSRRGKREIEERTGKNSIETMWKLRDRVCMYVYILRNERDREK